MTKKLTIAGMADLHGHLSHSCPVVDVLAIVGDFVPLYSSAENWKEFQELEWVKRKFIKWLGRQTATHKIVSFGNHDIVACSPATRSELNQILEEAGFIVLTPESPHCIIEGVKFSAYPYTPTIQSRNWAFSQQRTSPAVELGINHCIDHDTDVLLTHGPPLGFLDQVGSRHTGCAQLTASIINNGPSYVLCGHIHEQRGNRISIYNSYGWKTKLVNVSMCDRNYSVKGAKVQTIEIDIP